MMQATDLRNRDDFTNTPYGSRMRRILFQGQMSSRIEVVTEVSFQSPSQMSLSEHDHVIEAFSTNAAILLRSPLCGADARAAHRALVPRGLSAT